MTNEPLKFPGMNLFPEDIAAHLGQLIQRSTDLQPEFTRQRSMSTGLGGDFDKSPYATLGLSNLEDQVKSVSCAAIATEAARALGHTLTIEQLREINKQAELVYQNIPQVVHAFLFHAE